MIRALRNLLLFLGAAASLHAWPQSIAFINPGKSDEVYWVTAARAMQAAAGNLGMRLQVLYAERDHLRTVQFAREIAARPRETRPDFVIMSNDNGTGPEMLRILDGAGVRTFLAFSSIPVEARAGSGGPREGYKGWLGSLEPHAEDAGYLTAKALIEKGRKARAQAPDGKLHMIAIAGDRATPSSIRRNTGMARAVAETSDVVLDQTVYAAWARDKAAEQGEWLFQRPSRARPVWARHHLLGLRALQAWEERRRPAGNQPRVHGRHNPRP